MISDGETILKKESKKKYTEIFGALILTAVCYTAYVFTHSLYIDIDGYTISAVTNRIYDAENYCMFLHPWLCRLVGIISDIFSKADALALLEHLLFLIEAGMLFYVILSSEKYLLNKLFCSFVLISVFEISGLWNANFTVQAAALTGGGVILLYIGRKREKLCYKIFGTVLVSFGIMLRIEGALFFVPFVLLDAVSELVFSKTEKNRTGKDLFHLWVLPLMILGILLGTRIINNNSPKYAASVEYSKIRAEIVDYQYQPWENVQSSMPDVTQTEYEAACNWNLSDTENLNSEKLAAIAQHGKKVPFPLTLKGFAEVVPWMFFLFRGSTQTVKSLFAVIAVLFVAVMVSVLPIWRKIESFLVLLGGALIIWYFIFVGRAPFRVWEAVFLAIIMLLVIILAEEKGGSRIRKVIAVIGTVVLSAALTYHFWPLNIITPQLPTSSRSYSVPSEKYGDEIYIWNSDPSVIFKKKGKLPTREFLAHNIVEGDWIYGQVYFNNLLNACSISNPAEALALREDVYYVASDCRLMLEYLKEHFDENLQVMQIGVEDETPIWKFYSSDTVSD